MSNFVLDKAKTFSRDIAFPIAGDDGKWAHFEVNCQFRHLPKDEISKYAKDDAALLKAALIGVSGVYNADGSQVDPADAVDDMVKVSEFVYEAAMTYYDVKSGGNLRKTTPGRPRATG